MAGHNYGKRVGSAGTGHSPHRGVLAKRRCNLRIGPGFAGRNLLQLLPDFLLKGSAANIERNVVSGYSLRRRFSAFAPSANWTEQTPAVPATSNILPSGVENLLKRSSSSGAPL